MNGRPRTSRLTSSATRCECLHAVVVPRPFGLGNAPREGGFFFFFFFFPSLGESSRTDPTEEGKATYYFWRRWFVPTSSAEPIIGKGNGNLPLTSSHLSSITDLDLVISPTSTSGLRHIVIIIIIVIASKRMLRDRFYITQKTSSLTSSSHRHHRHRRHRRRLLAPVLPPVSISRPRSFASHGRQSGSIQRPRRRSCRAPSSLRLSTSER